MAHRAAAELPWRPTGLPASRLTRLVLNPQPDPTVDSSFRLGTVAQTAIGLSGLSAAYFYELRAGVQQDVQIDARHTVLEIRRVLHRRRAPSRRRADTHQLSSARIQFFSVYATSMIDASCCEHAHAWSSRRHTVHTKMRGNQVRGASTLLDRDSFAFEEEAAKRGMVAKALRTFDQWDSLPHLEGVSPVVIRKISNASRHDAITRGL
ncbi:hypothetical protein BC835DRAFT_480782 [Cytidiella melzeri]|nr:hypothetical protein BC835DRAFT_480782 [Cytidiella melzeri]